MTTGGGPTRLRAFADVSIFCALVVAIYFAGETNAAAVLLDGVPRAFRLPVQAFAMAQISIVSVLALVARDPDMAASLGVGKIAPARAIAGGIIAFGFAAFLVAARAFEGAPLITSGPLGSTPDDTRLMRELAHVEPIAVVPLACFVGFYEELLFRGFLLNRLRVLFGPNFAGAALSITLSAALFALGHTYKSTAGIFATFLIGAILGIVSWRMRSIWACVLAHAMIDTMALLGARLAVAAS
jgi:membrane protease YdiL (CAAX protease family)